MIRILAFIFLGFTVFSSCSDDSESQVTVSFEANYDGHEITTLDKYEYPGGGEVQFFRISFFVDELEFRSSSKEYKTESIDYFDFTYRDDLSKPKIEQSFKYESVEPGTYTDFSFLVGVNDTDNAKTPADFGSGSVLSETGEYWAAWDSYVFAKFEGRYFSTSGDTTSFVLHIGGSQSLMNIDLNNEVQIDSDQDKTVYIDLDIKKIFSGDTIYDIEGFPSLHSDSHLPKMLELAGNIEDSFTIR